MNVDIRLFDNTGERQPIPERFISNWDFELLERGGCGTFSLTLAAELDDQHLPALPAVDWRVEFWLGADATPIYRGWVELPSPAIQDGAPSLQLTGTGLMGRCQTLLAEYAYAKPYGADVSEVFADIAGRFLAGADRLGEFSQAIEGPLGYTLERAEFFGSTVRQAFDKLAEASEDLVMWGFDVDAEGRDRLFVRKRVTAVTNEDLRFRVGKDVSYVDQPEDLSTVVNAVHLTGGAAKTPNLVFNASFELPNTPADIQNSDPPAGNLLKDPSFSGGSPGWSYNGGASVKHTGDTPGIYARTGNTVAMLSGSGDNVTQSASLVAVGVDTPYLVVFQYALKQPGTSTIHVRVREMNGGSAVNTLVDQDITVTSRSYQEFRKQVALTSASTNKLEIRISYISGGPDVLLDDAFLFQADALVQDGWNALFRGTAKALIHWANTESPYHGEYCVQAASSGVSGSNNTVWIRPTRDHWISVRNKTTYVVRCWIRTTAALKLKLGLQRQGNGGGGSSVFSSEFTTSGAGEWEKFEATLSSGGNSTSLRPIIELRSNGTYYLDAAELYEAGIETRPNFLPGSNLEYWFRADTPQVSRTDLQTDATSAAKVRSMAAPFTLGDVGKTLRITGGTGWTAGDYVITGFDGSAYVTLGSAPAAVSTSGGQGVTSLLPGLSSAAQTSISTYGLREANVSVDQVQDVGQAQLYATGYLNRYAVPERQGTVALEPCLQPIRIVGDDVDATPAGQVLVTGARTGISAQNPVRITYTLTQGGAVRCEMELTNRRPDPALLLTRALRGGGTGGGGGGGSTNLQPAPGSSVGGGDDGTAPTWQVNDADVASRSRLDIVAGAGISVSGADDEANDRVTVTIDAQVEVQDAGTAIGARPALNLIAGTGVTITAVDNPADARVDVTFDTSGGGGGGRLASWYVADCSALSGSSPGAEMPSSDAKGATETAPFVPGAAGTITAISAWCPASVLGGVTVEIYVNGVTTGTTLSITSGSNKAWATGSIAVAAGDEITLYAYRSGSVTAQRLVARLFGT